MGAASYTPLDDVLETLAGYGVALANGNSNHAPMVAEALCAMGRPDAVMPWIARYRERMLPRPAAGRPVSRDDWRGALGQRDRFADWAAFFREELQEGAWPHALDRWVARLAPGFSAAATHGVIRVGHAVRALGAGETGPRLRELGDALASWAIASFRRISATATTGCRRVRRSRKYLLSPLKIGAVWGTSRHRSQCWTTFPNSPR